MGDSSEQPCRVCRKQARGYVGKGRPLVTCSDRHQDIWERARSSLDRGALKCGRCCSMMRTRQDIINGVCADCVRELRGEA